MRRQNVREADSNGRFQRQSLLADGGFALAGSTKSIDLPGGQKSAGDWDFWDLRTDPCGHISCADPGVCAKKTVDDSDDKPPAPPTPSTENSAASTPTWPTTRRVAAEKLAKSGCANDQGGLTPCAARVDFSLRPAQSALLGAGNKTQVRRQSPGELR